METSAIDTASAAVEVGEMIEDITAMDPKSRLSFIGDLLIKFAPKLLTATIILVIGLLLIRMVLSFTRKILKKSKLDPTLHSFLLSILGMAFYIILGIIVLSVLIPSAVSSLVALLSVFGLAVSLAVKDSLANLAGGLSVLFTKPFALNDYVKINGNEGSIQEIGLNYTVMKTFDNKVIHIPNGDVAKAEIINFTCEPTRRLDINFSIGYRENFELAKNIICEVVNEHPMVHTDPVPVVRMVQQENGAVVIGCRVWCNNPDYWSLNYDLLEQVKHRFDEENISVPFQQLYINSPAQKE